MHNYIVYKTAPRPGTEKLNKIPVNPLSGAPINPLDPQNWMTRGEAEATGHPIGVIVEPPYFCVDLDYCLTESGAWSQEALSMLARFPGAMVEVSVSGKGLHIFGRYSGELPPHRCRAPGVELYTRDRFIAVGYNAIGDAETDHTSALLALIAEIGEPVANAARGATAWTTEPCTEWCGPEDDDELINVMMRSKPSGQVALGVKASIQQLWNGDPDVLCDFYPDEAREFDASAADASLFSHLAFWTGKDCERMERLARRSGLNREKWDDRPDYIERTVLGAAAQCVNVYKCPALTKIETSAVTGGRGMLREGFQMLTAAQQIEYFAGCYYVRDEDRVLVPDGATLKRSQFDAVYGGYEFLIDFNGKCEKSAWVAFTQSRCCTFPKVDCVAFRPKAAPLLAFTEGGRKLINSYIPIEVPMESGDVSPFLTHLEKLLPVASDRAILLDYMAGVVQLQGTKLQWWPIIQGAEGNGKTALLKILAYAVGQRYSYIARTESLTNNFNAWVAGKLFVGIEEIWVQHRLDIANAIKTYVTNDQLPVEKKGVDEFMGDNYANGMALSNHEDCVIKHRGDRRYAVFFCAQQDELDILRDGMDADYFNAFYSWLENGGYAKTAHFLKTYQIANIKQLTYRAPETSSTQKAIEASLGPVAEQIIEAVGANMQGFRGGWVSGNALKRLLDNARIKISFHKRAGILREIGYIPHPALFKGRSTVDIPGDGEGRPVLYVKKGSIPAGSDTPVEAYQKAQGYIIAGGSSNAAVVQNN